MITFTPQIGMYGTLQTKTWTSYWIQLGTDCKEDHAVMYAGFIGGIEMVLEAKPSKGVCLSPLSNYDGIPIAWNRHEDLSNGVGERIFAFGLTHLNNGYSYLAILLNALRILHVTNDRFMSKRMKKAVNDMCSGFITICYRSEGRMIDDLPPWLWTPATLTYRTLYQ